MSRPPPAGGDALPPDLTVYFDGACPVCTREIAWYRNRVGPQVAFCDVAALPGDPAPDLTRAHALARFHVRDARGRLVSGASAFLAIWLRTPRLRILAQLLSVPPLPWVLERGYGVFLRLRRLWRPLPVRES